MKKVKVIINKNNGEVVYYGNQNVDIYTMYHMELKFNSPNVDISDYDIKEIDDEKIAKQIQKSIKAIYDYANDEFTFEFLQEKVIKQELPILNELDILQYRVDMLTYQLQELQGKINK